MSVCIRELGVLFRTNNHCGIIMDVNQITLALKDDSNVLSPISFPHRLDSTRRPISRGSEAVVSFWLDPFARFIVATLTRPPYPFAASERSR